MTIPLVLPHTIKHYNVVDICTCITPHTTALHSWNVYIIRTFFHSFKWMFFEFLYFFQWKIFHWKLNQFIFTPKGIANVNCLIYKTKMKGFENKVWIVVDTEILVNYLENNIFSHRIVYKNLKWMPLETAL